MIELCAAVNTVRLGEMETEAGIGSISHGRSPAITTLAIGAPCSPTPLRGCVLLTSHPASFPHRRTNRSHSANHAVFSAVWAALSGAGSAPSTLLLANSAPMGMGALMQISKTGSVAYELPAPLGRWISTGDGVGLEAGAHEGDLPVACPPGVC